MSSTLIWAQYTTAISVSVLQFVMLAEEVKLHSICNFCIAVVEEAMHFYNSLLIVSYSQDSDYVCFQNQLLLLFLKMPMFV